MKFFWKLFAMIWRFAALVILMEVAAAIAIKLAGGKPFGSMDGWAGIGLLACVLAFTVVIGFVTWVVVHSKPNNTQVEVAITLGIVIVVLFMIGFFGTVGLEWLGSMKETFESGGIWWPIAVFIACLISWFAKLSRR